MSYIKIVYKHRYILVQVKDDCRLLIKTIVFTHHLDIKEILLHGLYNTWKTFSLLYKPSTVNPLCCDAASDSCGASRPTLTSTHFLNLPIERGVGYPLGPVTKRGVFLPTESNHWRISLIIKVGSLLLCTLLFQVRCDSLTLQFRTELRFDHQTVTDWSQF